MFSTMGNAVTFPLETLIFWALGHATILQEQGTLSHFPKWEDRHLCSVFGDDCIIPTQYAEPFIRTMTRVGFIINKEKSFYDDGGFRESCGGDYLHGNPVRPYSLKGPANNKRSSVEPWLYIIANSLIPKYISCFGGTNYIYDKELFTVLSKLFSQYDIAIKLVPDYFPVGVDHHGTYSFNFMRFQYRRQARRVDDLHFCAWLKSPGGRRSPWWTRKKNGGYVVAKGKSAHWTVTPAYSRRRRP